MGIRRMTFFVEGMTCSSCEARIASALRRVDGVTEARASQRRGTAWVDFDDSAVGAGALKAAIERAGYPVRDRKSAAGTMIALGIGVLLVAAYMIATQAGAFSALPRVDASIGYGMLFVIGLLTSVHCVAMCGGIALSQSVGSAAPVPGASPRAGRLERMVPGLLYNGGRVLSYTIIGAIVGALGSALSFSPVAKGIIAAVAGLFMVLFGLRMLGVVSGLPSASRLLPAGLRNALGRLGTSLRRRGPFAVGILNGLMPCGPLQTMQLYALGTGSALAGALSMLIFSAGTVPLMLAFGLAAALLPRRFVPVMVKASAVLVMFLGVVTFARAASLAGIALPGSASRSSGAALASAGGAIADAVLASGSAAGAPLEATLSDGFQAVTTVFGPNSYVPFVVKAGVPLKWTIRIRAGDLNGCNNAIAVPEYGIQKKLRPGDNLVEFTPRKTGVIAYSCWMGMIRSSITVVGELGSAGAAGAAKAGAAAAAGAGGLQGMLGSCCWSPSADVPAAAADASAAVPIGLPLIKGGIQEISIDVSAQGYSPSEIVLQKGKKAVIRFRPSQLTSCNYQVLFPEYNGALDLSKGQLETPPIAVTADFGFQFGMGMLRGHVKAVDDLSKIDMNGLRAELAAAVR
jgi:uncharacterized protein